LLTKCRAVIKSRIMRWDRRGAYKVLVGKPEGEGDHLESLGTVHVWKPFLKRQRRRMSPWGKRVYSHNETHTAPSFRKMILSATQCVLTSAKHRKLTLLSAPQEPQVCPKPAVSRGFSITLEHAVKVRYRAVEMICGNRLLTPHGLRSILYKCCALPAQPV
jgi:hypothetical protein